MRKTWRSLWVWCLMSLILVVAFVVPYRSAIRQRQLNHALMAAIQRDDPTSVKWLLEQGADPNTHLRDAEIVSLSQVLRDLVRGHSLSHSTAPSALQVALSGGIDIDRNGAITMTTGKHHLSIVTMLLNRGAAINPRAVGSGPNITAATFFDKTPDVVIANAYGNGIIAVPRFVASQREVSEFTTALAKARHEKRLLPIF